MDEVLDAGEVKAGGESVLLLGVVESLWLMGARPVQEDGVGGAARGQAADAGMAEARGGDQWQALVGWEVGQPRPGCWRVGEVESDAQFQSQPENLAALTDRKLYMC